MELLIACLSTSILISAMHFSPLYSIAREYPIIGYVIGTLALIASECAALGYRGDWPAVWVILAVTFTSGATLAAWYALGWALHNVRLRRLLEKEVEIWRNAKTNNSPRD